MNANKIKEWRHCYAIFSKRTNKLVKFGNRLPIFYNKKICEQIAIDYKNVYIKRIEISKIENLFTGIQKFD